MAQVITAGLPFSTRLLGDGTGSTFTTSDLLGTANGSEQRVLGSANFNVPSGLTVTLQKTFQNPSNPDAVWTTVTTGLTNTDYYYSGPLVSGLRFLRTAGTGTVLGTMSEMPGVLGSSATTPSVVVGNVASGATDSGAPVKVGGVYNTSAPTLTNGQRGDMQLDVNANLKTREQYQPGYEDNTNGNAATIEKLLAGVSTYSPTLFTNFGANATLNVKATAGNVYAIHCQNTNAAIRYIQIHNTATTPGGGAVPLLSFAIPASSSVTITHDLLVAGGVYFSTGIAFAFSTTLGTYTAGTAGEQSTTILFK